MSDTIEVDGFTDLRRIGRGGLGDVYRAVRASTGGVVAIKILRDVSDESVAWHRTRRELTALVTLAGHAHVVQLLELLELPAGPALVMEYAPNGSVADLLDARGGSLTVAEAVLIGRHTAAALVAAHAQGIVHRDLKPQNLLVDAYGQVKLCDFGIASLTRSDEFRTRTNARSMRYASPEDLEDEAAVGPASDVYSLGAALLHVARGAPPTLKERLAPWTPPDDGADGLAALDAILAACLHPDPSARPSASEVFERLEQLEWTFDDRLRRLEVPEQVVPDSDGDAEDVAPADGVTATTVFRPGRRPAEDPPPIERPAPPVPRRRRTLALVAVGAAVTALAVAAWWIGVRDDAADDPVRTAPATTTAGSPSTTQPPPTTQPSVAATFDVVDVVARPDGLVSIDDPDVVWPTGEVGECLVQVAGEQELVVVGCAEPHDLQRIGSGELPSSQATFDQSIVRDAVRELCAEAFAEVVGVDLASGTLDVPFTAPSSASWSEGDRGYQCFVGVAGQRLVGDATGAGL